MDMAQGYIGATQAHAPQAAIVFDRFHIEPPTAGGNKGAPSKLIPLTRIAMGVGAF